MQRFPELPIAKTVLARFLSIYVFRFSSLMNAQNLAVVKLYILYHIIYEFDLI